MSRKPGTNTGRDGGLYQEVGPRGTLYEHYVTVGDHERLPSTRTPGNAWKLIKRLPPNGLY